MEFEQNAAVFTAKGDAVGHIGRVVVNPESKAITHIVVRKGFLFTEDKVVPIAMIAEATDERIVLREDAGDLQALPVFEEKHYVRLDGSAGPASAVISQPLAGMPAAYAPAPAEKLIQQVEQHIPEGTVALKEGAKVITSEGRQLGSVERVIAEPETDHATHLLVSSGLLAKEKKLIPITWVMIRGENEVLLTVEPNLVEELSEYRSS